tara:strand:+ start:5467 stop:5775 length:309 start_codon:yes stop_codon:yes gene_type:complete
MSKEPEPDKNTYLQLGDAYVVMQTHHYSHDYPGPLTHFTIMKPSESSDGGPYQPAESISVQMYPDDLKRLYDALGDIIATIEAQEVVEVFRRNREKHDDMPF